MVKTCHRESCDVVIVESAAKDQQQMFVCLFIYLGTNFSSYSYIYEQYKLRTLEALEPI